LDLTTRQPTGVSRQDAAEDSSDIRVDGTNGVTKRDRRDCPGRVRADSRQSFELGD